uniref:Predicted protein n=1 Tax=Hordeum vulgare subsp. vulgare TaxID=112509 RepID=F2EA84_HORVV|nr:predicted protein [Hordeum vulgare subsp. vulgare]
MPPAFTPCPARPHLAAMTARVCKIFSFPYLQNEFRSLSRLNSHVMGLF